MKNTFEFRMNGTYLYLKCAVPTELEVLLNFQRIKIR